MALEAASITSPEDIRSMDMQAGLHKLPNISWSKLLLWDKVQNADAMDC